MNKILMLILLITLYLNPIQAQIKQGSWMIGGSMSLSRETSNFELWVRPKMGYFVTNRLLMGASVDFEFAENNSNLFLARKFMQLKTLPFVRYYFTPTHRFKFFNEIEAEWTSDYTKIVNIPILNPPFIIVSANLSNWSKQNRFWLRNRFGVNYFLSDNIAVEAQLPYTFYYKEDSISYFKPKLEYYFPKFTFNPTFRIRLFLNTAKQRADILAEKYLKKGNRTYGIRGSVPLTEGFYSTFVPNIGYFITDKWMIGTQLWIIVPNKGDIVSDIAANIAPEIRFYQPISPKMQWLTQASTQLGLFGSLKSSYTQMGTGLNQFVSENISVQCLLGSDMFFENDKLRFRPNFNIGFQYFMSKK